MRGFTQTDEGKGDEFSICTSVDQAPQTRLGVEPHFESASCARMMRWPARIENGREHPLPIELEQCHLASLRLHRAMADRVAGFSGSSSYSHATILPLRHQLLGAHE